MKQNITVGAKVQIVNQTPDGKEFVEGFAVIRGMDGITMQDDYVYCSVKFAEDESPVYRWIRRELL
jgi:hypothetical protein